MATLSFLYLVAALFAATTALLLALAPRLGKASYSLVLHLVPGLLAALALGLDREFVAWSRDTLLGITYSLVILAAPGAYLFGRSLTARENRTTADRVLTPLVCGLGPLLVALSWLAPMSHPALVPPQFLATEGWGLAGALYLLGVSVWTLARLEQAFRSAAEHVRWRIKFPLLGLALSLGVLVYLSAKVLIFRLIPRGALPVYPLSLLASCPLLFAGWRRGEGRMRIRLSQEAVYGSLTLVIVGAYLVLSSLLAAWAGSLTSWSTEAAALVFFLAIAFLASVLLSTSYRHRVKGWLRRHVFSGRYDYRTFWLEAVEKIQERDPPDKTAAALAELVERAMGSLDVTVWLRVRNTGDLRLAAVRGSMKASEGERAEGGLAPTERLHAPRIDAEAETDPVLHRILERTNAHAYVALRSGEETLGLLTCGRDRSGTLFDREAGEFLRVVARHAAGEFRKQEFLADAMEAKEAEAFRSFAIFLLHDLKNFASTLSLIARNAARHADNPEFRREAFESVLDIAEKMKRLCNSLGTFSESPARAERRLVEVNRLVREAAEALDGSLDGTLRVECAEDLPLCLLDPGAVTGALRHLLMNSAEAIEPGGQVTISTALRDGGVEIRVEDDGCGMSREFVENELFQPFRTTKSDGLGIGLFQVRRTAEAQGGTVDVESEQGKGTKIRLTFPPAPSKEA